MKLPTHIIPGESVEEFDALSASMQAEYQPATVTERYLVDSIIQHEWLMRRALRMQEALLASAPSEDDVDPKKLTIVMRYYKTHERSCERAKRELDSLRKQQRKTEKAMQTQGERESAAVRREQRQWEQILKKMPTLTNWVN